MAVNPERGRAGGRGAALLAALQARRYRNQLFDISVFFLISEVFYFCRPQILCDDNSSGTESTKITPSNTHGLAAASSVPLGRAKALQDLQQHYLNKK